MNCRTSFEEHLSPEDSPHTADTTDPLRGCETLMRHMILCDSMMAKICMFLTSRTAGQAGRRALGTLCSGGQRKAARLPAACRAPHAAAAGGASGGAISAHAAGDGVSPRHIVHSQLLGSKAKNLHTETMLPSKDQNCAPRDRALETVYHCKAPSFAACTLEQRMGRRVL